MSDSRPNNSTPLATLPRRFSTRTLLITTTVVAVLCSVLFGLPPWVALIVFGVCSLAIKASLVAGALTLRGKQQAFCCGALLPYLTGDTLSASVFRSGLGRGWGLNGPSAATITAMILLLGGLMAAGLSGWISVLVTSWLQRHRDSTPNSAKPEAPPYADRVDG